MALKVWIDGRLHDKDDAKISVYDHGLLYGDGVFEGIRVYNGRIFECDAHIDRLWASAKAIRMTISLSREQVRSAMEETIKANSFRDCYIRLVVTRGVGYLGLNPNKCPTPTVIVITDTIDMYPKETYEKGMTVITASVIRNHPNALSPRIKSLNYLNNILAKIEAVDAGVPEAIMLNHEGNVAECTADNIFIVRRGIVLTPGTADGILEGITRKVIIELCRGHSIPIHEKTLQRHDLYVADECFLTGSAAEVIPVTKIDGRAIGTGQPGPVTRKLMEIFHRHVRDSKGAGARSGRNPPGASKLTLHSRAARVSALSQTPMEVRMQEYETLKRLVTEADDDVQKAIGGNKAAGTRVRKKMQEIKSAAQNVRQKILEGRGGEAGASTSGASEQPQQ